MMKDGMIEDWDLFENRFEIIVKYIGWLPLSFFKLPSFSLA